MRRFRVGHALLATAVAAGGALAGSAALAETAPVPDSPSLVRPLLIGATAPQVTLHKTDGSAFDLKSALTKQPSVVVFYRGGW